MIDQLGGVCVCINIYICIYEYYEELVHRIMELRSPMICGLQAEDPGKAGVQLEGLRGREPMV